jgi:phosphoglucosamine mutase
MLVTGSGKVVDGDAVLLLAAADMQDTGHLKVPTVVATVMSNLGLERALSARGIELVRTSVGDKYVLEEMVRRNALVGGEQSGHVIFREFATTGDGMLTALRVLEIVCKTRRSLDDLSSAMQVYPQVLVNIRVKERKPLAELPAVQQAIQSVENEFGDGGRVLVRFSGTEPLARVMVEGLDHTQVQLAADRIATAIRQELA